MADVAGWKPAISVVLAPTGLGRRAARTEVLKMPRAKGADAWPVPFYALRLAGTP